MRHICKGLLAVGVAIIAASTLSASAKTMPTPADRCVRLGVQVEQTIKAKASDRQVAAANLLQKQGAHLCGQHKWAEGIRSYAKSLRLFGVKPMTND